MTAVSHHSISGSFSALHETEFKALLGRCASGVVVVTAPGDPPAGFTASSFTSVSLHPPLVSFCIAEKASAARVFARAETVAVHVLHRGQESVARTFATSGIDRFAASGVVQAGPDGVPLIDRPLARILCTVFRRVSAGDHTIVLATPVAGDISMDPEATPLIYHAGGYTRVDTSARPSRPF